MATVVFTGTVTAVAQVTTVQVTLYDASTTYTITVGASPNTTTIDTVGNTSVNQTATDIATNFDSAGNYASGVAPVNGDTVYVQPGAPPICWNIDTSLTGIVLNLPDGIGNIGLNSSAFAQSADGATVETAKPEYRETYLKMDWETCSIGRSDGPSSVTSPTRLMLWNEQAGSSQTYVYSVPGVSADAGKPTLRLHTINANANILVFSAVGGWGLAVDTKDETSTAGSLGVFADSSATKTYVGEGSTITTFEQTNGTSLLRAAADVSVVLMHGGTLTTEGNLWKISTLTMNGGTVNLSNNDGTTAISTLEGNAGTLNVVKAPKAVGSVTVTTITPRRGFALQALDNNLAFTTMNLPTGAYTVTWS
jgi:hypothetical protein